MNAVSDSIAEDIHHYLQTQQTKGLLRFITCGSVDDGKSTLIGRLLYESKMLFEDQLGQLETDSKHQGTQGGDLDFALLVDGLSAERKQGITIDVAYRFFSTDKRKFIVADTPGHNHHTQVAIETQDNFLYVQNLVVLPLTHGAPRIDAIVEECFPPAAMTDPQAFFDAVGDEEKFQCNLAAMMDSCKRFLDFDKIDVVPTSQYLIKVPTAG